MVIFVYLVSAHYECFFFICSWCSKDKFNCDNGDCTDIGKCPE